MTTAAPAPHWTDFAACKGAEVAMFPHDADDEPQSAPAKALCGRCPVRPECRDEVMRAEDGDGRNKRHGVVGGLTPLERWKRDRVRIDPVPQPRRGGRKRAVCGTPEAAARHRRYKEALCDACRTAEQHPQNPQE